MLATRFSQYLLVSICYSLGWQTPSPTLNSRPSIRLGFPPRSSSGPCITPPFWLSLANLSAQATPLGQWLFLPPLSLIFMQSLAQVPVHYGLWHASASALPNPYSKPSPPPYLEQPCPSFCFSYRFHCGSYSYKAPEQQWLVPSAFVNRMQILENSRVWC